MLCFETLLKHSVWIYTSLNFKDHLELPSESNEQKIPTSKFFFIFPNLIKADNLLLNVW